jgi:hypothetical protein
MLTKNTEVYHFISMYCGSNGRQKNILYACILINFLLIS